MTEQNEEEAIVVDQVEILPAESEEGHDNLWAMTLTSGPVERIFVLTADQLRQMAEDVLKRSSS